MLFRIEQKYGINTPAARVTTLLGFSALHAVGGATGAILTGVFAIKEYGGTPGLIEAMLTKW
jgi:ammonia channel protein AmtB